MKQLKPRGIKRLKATADWWRDLSPEGKTNWLADNPNSPQARQVINEGVETHERDMQQQEADADMQRQLEEKRRAEDEAAANAPPPPAPKAAPVFRKAPPPDTSVPSNSWEHMKVLPKKGRK